MAKKSKEKTTTKDWKSTIKQSCHSRAVTLVAQKRKIAQYLKFGAIACGVLLVFGAIGGGVYWVKSNPNGTFLAGPSEPLRYIDFETDGVLTRNWLDEHLDLPEGISLMDVDIFSVQDELMGYGQTASVMVERVFPNKLRITVKEHIPVLRLKVLDASGEGHWMLVSDQGHVYSGINYRRETLARLPGVTDVVLKRNGNRFEPIEGIPVVAELLRTARHQVPLHFDDWRYISCKNFKGNRLELGAEIRVHTRSSGVIVFAPNQFSEQLNRLGDVLAHTSRERLGGIKSIDLSLSDPAVRFEDMNTFRRSLSSRRL